MSGSPPHTPFLSGSLPCTPTRSRPTAQRINSLTSNTSDSPSLSALASLTRGAHGASSRHRYTKHYGSTWNRGRRSKHGRRDTGEDTRKMDDHDEANLDICARTCAFMTFTAHLVHLCLPFESLGRFTPFSTSKSTHGNQTIYGASCNGSTSPTSESIMSSMSSSYSEDGDDDDDSSMEQIRDDLGRIVRLGSIVSYSQTHLEGFCGGDGQRRPS